MSLLRPINLLGQHTALQTTAVSQGRQDTTQHCLPWLFSLCCMDNYQVPQMLRCHGELHGQTAHNLAKISQECAQLTAGSGGTCCTSDVSRSCWNGRCTRWSAGRTSRGSSSARDAPGRTLQTWRGGEKRNYHWIISKSHPWSCVGLSRQQDGFPLPSLPQYHI